MGQGKRRIIPDKPMNKKKPNRQKKIEGSVT
jgi:hypothetical protein